MSITYKETHQFAARDLESLFLSVNWSSGRFPERLAIAMRNFETVYSAWDGDQLVGLVCAMDDGIMNAYVHYLLVRPAYQNAGIGRELMARVKAHYRDYLRITLVAYAREQKFYEACGFAKSQDAVPMFITDLWT